MSDARYDWIILNQSQSPVFQRMLEHVSGDARGLLVTGAPFPSENPRFDIERAPTYDRSSLTRRAASWSLYLAAATLRVLRCPGHPFLLAVTNPPMLPHLASALGMLAKHRYGLLIWDIYPEHAVRLGLLDDENLVVRAWHALNRLSLSRAEFVVTLGENMAQALRDELGTSEVPIEVIPNWADTDTLKPLAKRDNPFAASHGQGDKLTVLYSGNIGASHGLDALVNAAELVRNDTNIAFVVIGDGLGRPALERAVRERKLSNIQILDYVEWDTFPQSQAMGDIAVISQAPGTEHLSVPSKTYAALAAGSALLALTRPGSDLARLVETHEVGVVHEPDDADGIAASLRELARSPERLAALRAAARRTAEQYYSAHVVEARWRDLLTPFLESSA